MSGPRKVDVLILGGGSAGSVLAARLSEDSRRTVMLVEAGRDLTADTMPAAVASPYPGRAYFDPGLIWQGLTVTTGGTRTNEPSARPTMPYTQARVLGGGSSVNGIGANRGAPSDYDEWEAAGARGWSWETVLPYFRKLERDLELTGPLHGSEGPIPVRRIPETMRSGYARAVVAALGRRGFAEKPDQNGPWEDGVFPLAANLDESFHRVPTSIGYLTPEVRRRANLTVTTGSRAVRLILAGRRVTGAVIATPAGEIRVEAEETIVSCGALHSPALLMRSGIGPGEHLAERGIAVAVDRRGVGLNLMEHPSAGVTAYLPPAMRMPAREARHHIPAIWRYSSGLNGTPAGDMHVAIVTRGSWHGIGRRMGLLYFWVNKAYGRGTVRLGADIAGEPEVDFRMLSDERDRLRLMDAMRRSASVLSEIAATGAIAPPLPARMSDRARRFGAPTPRNALLTGLGGLALDLAGPAAPHVFRRMVGDGTSLDALVADDAALSAYLDEVVVGVWHASGSCRMGRDDDPLAVTDEEGRVHGVSGLRVCDASLFPTIPSANINLPVIMVAERVADLIKAGESGSESRSR